MAGNMKDFATGIVATAPSPADSGTSLVLQTGEGARMPATPFYATAHPASEFPTLDNAEKIQVTNVSTNTLTIVRAQGDTTAKNIEAGWRISNALFLDNIPDTFDDLTDGTTNKAYTSTEKTKLAGIEVAADVTDAQNVGSSIHGSSAKTTPVDADTLPLIDSAASNVLKKVTWANIKATLKTYFDTLYQPIDATLTALAGLATGANKIPMSSGTDTFTQLDFKDEDTMSSNSDTALPSQQSVKAYVDARAKVTYTALPMFFAKRSSDLANGSPGTTFTEVPMNAEDLDVTSNFSTSTGRFTPNVAGWYSFSAAVGLRSLGDQLTEHVMIAKNGDTAGSTWPRFWSRTKQSGSGEVQGVVSEVMFYLNGSTDYVSVFVWNSGGTTNITAAPNTWFTGRLVKPD